MLALVDPLPLQEKPHQAMINLLQAAGDSVQSLIHPFRCTYHMHLAVTRPVGI